MGLVEMEVFLAHLAVERQGVSLDAESSLGGTLALSRDMGADLPGLKNVGTTIVDTLLLNRNGRGVVSPLNGLNWNFSHLV
jgi:hypothetical protein